MFTLDVAVYKWKFKKKKKKKEKYFFPMQA